MIFFPISQDTRLWSALSEGPWDRCIWNKYGWRKWFP